MENGVFVHRTTFFVLLLLAAATMAGCLHSGPVQNLQVARTLITLEPGESFVIDVLVNDKGNRGVDIEVAADTDCFDARSTGAGVQVQANGDYCSGELSISAPGNDEARTVQINVEDPMSLDIGDGLRIRYVHQYTQRYSSIGSGADHKFYLWQPKAPSGYYPLGSTIWEHQVNLNDAKIHPSIVVRDSLERGTLAPPTDYEQVWRDQGAGVGDWGSWWRPICPEGYDGLGFVAGQGKDTDTYYKPGPNDIRCVREDLVMPAEIGAKFMDNRGNGGDFWLHGYRTRVPEHPPSDAGIPLLTGSTIGCGGPSMYQDDCRQKQMSSVNILSARLPVVEAVDNEHAGPILDGTKLQQVPRFFSAVRIPFTLIPAAQTPEQVDFHVTRSPFYTVYQTETYKPLGSIVDNTEGDNPITREYTYSTGWIDGTTKSFSKTVGIKVSLGGDAQFLGTGGSWSVDMSTELGWDVSRSSTYTESSEETTTYTYSPGTVGAVVQVQTSFVAENALGQRMSIDEGGLTSLEGGSSIVKFLRWEPEGGSILS